MEEHREKDDKHINSGINGRTRGKEANTSTVLQMEGQEKRTTNTLRVL